MPFSVRRGGRTGTASGTSSQKDGLAIGLSRYINGVAVDPAKKLAFDGGGAIWETVEIILRFLMILARLIHEAVVI